MTTAEIITRALLVGWIVWALIVVLTILARANRWRWLCNLLRVPLPAPEPNPEPDTFQLENPEHGGRLAALINDIVNRHEDGHTTRFALILWRDGAENITGEVSNALTDDVSHRLDQAKDFCAKVKIEELDRARRKAYEADQ